MESISKKGLQARRKDFDNFIISEGQQPGTAEMTPCGQEEALIRETAIKTICLGCFALKWGNCTGFKEGNGSLPKAVASFTENQQSDAQRTLTVIRAEKLAPCGLLATALTMTL